jgi:FkbM family methyltransferase
MQDPGKPISGKAIAAISKTETIMAQLSGNSKAEHSAAALDIRIERNKPGFTVLGTHNTSECGVFSVEFFINVSDAEEAGDCFCGRAEVLEITSKAVVRGRANLFVRQLRNNGGRVRITLTLSAPTKLRFRVHSNGKASLYIVQFPQVSGISDVIDGFESTSELSEAFGELRENGFELTKSMDNEQIATINGVSVYLPLRESCYIANEIFANNIYNFSYNIKMMAIDIGMNVGMASLYMAKLPNVLEIHSFEPFRTPFLRALDNFDLNKELSKKITPNNYGLGMVNETIQVLTRPGRTIGQTISGFDTGIPELISIRNAAEVFLALTARAEANQMEVFVKIDCEGSEFVIIEALRKAALLNMVRAIIMEWHKKGSQSGSQAPIVDSLIENNFLVFDHANPTSKGGMLYAVRVV